MEKKQYIDIEIVKTLMHEKGIDIKTLSSLLGVTPPTVKKFLDGADQRRLRANTVLKLVKALNVSSTRIIHKDYQ